MSENNIKKVSVVQININNVQIHQIEDENTSAKNTGPRIGSRHIQVVLMALGFFAGIGTRTNLSVAVVAMTDNTTSPNPDVPTYDWNNTSIILSSFFWSYITLQVVAGYVGKTYGPKYFFLVALFINFCACALTPLAAAKLGSTGVILMRITQGFGQAFLYPSINVLLGRWAPQEERTTLFSFTYTGAYIGSISGSLVTGYVAASWWGWPTSYYILSAMGFCWCIIWLIFGHNSPASHPRISSSEKQYIESSLDQEENLNIPIPWKKILTSVPFYAFIIGAMGYTWGYAILMTETPTYLANVMNFDLKSNALLTSLLTASTLICSLFTGPFSDWIISRKILSPLNARRYLNLIGSYGEALCLIWVSFLKPSQSTLCIVALGMGNGLVAFSLVGCMINHLDLSPRFSGILYGIMNAICTVVSIAGPFSANWIVTDQTDAAQWQSVFLIAAGALMLGGAVFFFFSSATRQPWDGEENPKLEGRRKKISVISAISM